MIKQNGGVFGRNPTFKDVTLDRVIGAYNGIVADFNRTGTDGVKTGEFTASDDIDVRIGQGENDFPAHRLKIS